MRKITILALLVALLMTLTSIAAPPLKMSPAKTGASGSVAEVDNESYIDVNNIFMFVTNHGNFGRDLAGVFGNDYGTFFPYNSINEIETGALSNSPLYASGMWIGGRNSATDSIQVVTAEYSDEYVPGPMVGGTYLPDNASFRVYKLYKDSMFNNPNQDWLEFPHGKTNQNGVVNLDHGAPWTLYYTVDSESGDTTAIDTIPRMIGDQMLWAVFNDANPDQHDNDNGETEPMGIEVRQTTFGYNRVGPLGNMIFLRLQAFNKGGNTFDSLYFSLWADPDLGGSGDDFVACNPELSLGYVYNATNRDQQYGSAPPCLGYDFFQGPMRVRTAADTTDDGEPIYGRMWGQIYMDSVNIGMVSFNRYINGTDPDNKNETYNYMRGLKRDGTQYTYNGLPTTFFNNSDPVAKTGDLDVAPADRRFMLSTGPITFAPGDSTEILAAIIIGQGSDKISSIQVMRYYDEFAQLAFDSTFAIPEPPAPPDVTVKVLDASISLVWTDTSEVDHGWWPFEGYTVYQGESSVGPWRKLAYYDLDNGIGTIYDVVLSLEGALENRAVKFGVDAGVIRYYIATEDAINGGPLRNLTDYYYKVEAYSYEPTAKPNHETSETILIIKPQFPIAGTEYGFAFQDTIPVVHSTGISDGKVYPFVIDPTIFNGHTYRVTFEDTLGIVVDTIITEDPEGGFDTTLNSTDIAWHLDDVTADERLLEWQPNQSGDIYYDLVDGMLIIVTGPSADGLKPDDVNTTADESLWGWDIPEGTRRFTWAGGAAGFGFEGFEGSIGWSSPDQIYGSGSMTVLATETKDVLFRLATTDAAGNFNTTDDENVSYAYRYGRAFANPPAKPEFAPYIINPGSYVYQDYEKSVPLSAWDVESNPPRRLALGFLENNVYWGEVDGKWYPPVYTADTSTEGPDTAWGNNYEAGGPREWLFVLDEDYSETPDADYMGSVIDPAVRCMYFVCLARRSSAAWSPGGTGEDQLILHDQERNLPADTFTFVATAPIVELTGEQHLERINVVPNPYYLHGPYDPTPGNTQLMFQHLPATCTISIYNLAGDLIDKIEKNDPSTSSASWNIKSSNNLPLASGIYIYVVDAPGYGSKVGKMAIFTEVEVLDIY